MVVELMLEDVYADDALITDTLVQRHFNLLLRAGNRKAFTDRAQVSDNKPPVDIIEKITAPTLILWGAEDARISPEYAYEFHRRIHGALLKIYQNTGHWPQEENPGQTVEDVMAFLEGKF
jgi:pimeloyl-ACP methyl ester carboxylesterase